VLESCLDQSGLNHWAELGSSQLYSQTGHGSVKAVW